jgi:membrane protein implicated in regulation of membrane protease activity
MVWWLWMAVGIVLLGIELLSPGGFYVLFFGMAALAIGILAGLGIGGPPWLQWFLFSVLAVVSLLLFRNPLLKKMRAANPDAPAVETVVGEVATPLENIARGAIGKVELRGATWSARNADQKDLASGQRCRVHQVDGLVLLIRAE